MSRKPPKPEVTEALLPSFGYGPGVPRITKHKYVRTMECNLPSPDGEAWEHIFSCQETGAERRWGTEDREPIPEELLS